MEGIDIAGVAAPRIDWDQLRTSGRLGALAADHDLALALQNMDHPVRPGHVVAVVSVFSLAPQFTIDDRGGRCHLSRSSRASFQSEPGTQRPLSASSRARRRIRGIDLLASVVAGSPVRSMFWSS